MRLDSFRKMKEREKMKSKKINIILSIPAIFALLTTCVICGGCGDEGMKGVMKKMPWAEEEEPEKSELDLLKEECEALKTQYTEKKQELQTLQKDVKGNRRANKRGGVTVNLKCSKCGQNKSITKTAYDRGQLGKCFFCSAEGPWQVIQARDDSDQDARLAKMKRIGELQKEMKALKEKIIIIAEKGKKLQAEEAKSGRKKKK
jgi:hypothetical protein